jgi:hypothetical protein
MARRAGLLRARPMDDTDTDTDPICRPGLAKRSARLSGISRDAEGDSLGEPPALVGLWCGSDRMVLSGRPP